jgi:glycyl-tRNA synthetase (class II)
MARQDGRTYPLEKQVSLADPEVYEPIQDRAVKNLAHYAEDVYDFEDLVEHLGLREALCRVLHI